MIENHKLHCTVQQGGCVCRNSAAGKDTVPSVPTDGWVTGTASGLENLASATHAVSSMVDL